MSPLRNRFGYSVSRSDIWHRHAGGYGWTSEALNHLFNVALCVPLLVLMAPVFIVLAMVVLISDGRPIFYAGTRLGRNKRPFTMYKFRTLKRGAENVIGAAILEVNHRQGTRHGKFLRDTRLDEFPQLFNVLRRDMDLVGPRPIRPLLYETICKQIPGYDRRFAVNAGLIGYAQLFTPHNTPKRIRVSIDNALVKQKQKPFASIMVVAFTGYIVIETTVRRGLRGIRRAMFEHHSEKRNYERLRLGQTEVLTSNGELGSVSEHAGWIQDINEEAFLVLCKEPLPDPLPTCFKLTREVRHHCRHKIKSARCRGTLFRQWKAEDGQFAYVFTYKPNTPLMGYQIHQYFLQNSFA